jgi:hypothetical protein
LQARTSRASSMPPAARCLFHENLSVISEQIIP